MVSVEPRTPLRAVIEKLVGSGVGLVVVDDGGSTAGVVSEHDILDALHRGGDIDDIVAGDVMSTDLLTAEPGETIGDAARRMTANRVRHLLVFGEQGGVVSIRDVLEAVVSGREVPPRTAGEGPEVTAEIELTGGGLGIDDVVAVARRQVPVRLGAAARQAMSRSAAVVERLAANSTPAYGVTTGFGSLADIVIPPGRTAELQLALVRSHAAGMGDPVEPEVVRAMVLLRARSLAMAYSGVRPEIVDAQLALLRHGITPIVPEHGSLGASGDLAPLSHCALVLVGEGEVWAPDGRPEPARQALERVGISPLSLRAKEGLALINGTDGMLALLCLALHDLAALLGLADVVAAATVEGLLGTDRAFAADLLALRPQRGQVASGRNLRRLLAGSAIVAGHRRSDSRVQDAYSLRCTPQVHGAARDTLVHATVVAERELEAAIDNPMVLPDGRVESVGNFHGAPLALACDFLSIAVAELSAISERRTDRLLDATRSQGLPPFLSTDPGVNSGLMIAHYTQAALALENQHLAVPASTRSLPTSAMQEDHVSNGWAAGRQLRSAVANLRRILAVELVVAAAALDLRGPLVPAAGTGAAVEALRSFVPGPGSDRWLSPELAQAERLLADGTLVRAVEAAIGRLEPLS